MKPVICLTILWMGILSLLAQEPATGLLWEDEVYDSLPRQSSFTGAKSANLPPTVDLSAFCPEVRNQGEVYSCVGWAVGYGAMSIQQAVRNGWKEKSQITGNAYSAMFIYNQIKTGPCRQGAQLSAAMDLLRQRGDCLARDFDQDPEDCERQPSSVLMALAQRDTITDYLTLFAQNDPAQVKIQRVKEALARMQPVIVGLNIRANFYQLKGARYWWPKLGNTSPAGGHAIVVVGYDEPSGSFLLFNSWGTSWGDKGFIRVKYDDFAEHCKYAYVLITGSTVAEQVPANSGETSLQTLAIDCRLQYYDATDAENPFKPATLAGKQGTYGTAKPWQVGQLFQLQVETFQNNTFLYVFSIDALQNIHVHWPRRGVLDERFAGMNESALVPDAGSVITIPAPEKAMRISNPGTDRLYVLATTQPIRDLHFLCEKMRYTRDSAQGRLRQLMGKHIIPLADTDFGTKGASGRVATLQNGYILPMVIELTAIPSDGQ